MDHRPTARHHRRSDQERERPERQPDLRRSGHPGTGAPLSLDPDALTGRERHALLTSLVVPRPIGWISTRGPEGTPNLAPFSYFAAVSASPFLVSVSIGHRRSGPKDTLVNIRARRAFCTNVVTEPFLEAMNLTSAEYGPEVDEFLAAGLEAVDAEAVDAPRVAACPASLECELFREVDLGGAPNTLVLGRVRRVHVDPGLLVPGSRRVDPDLLRPVGRLGGADYARLGEIIRLPRPR